MEEQNTPAPSRFSKFKAYLGDHLPEIVTACAAVGSLVVIRRQALVVAAIGQLLATEVEARSEQTALVNYARDHKLKFDYYPGLGVFMRPEVDESE